ncbi:MAG: hypothetical protein HW412_1071 [Bacteroidetes bacterium]|nr:hypothetical protein [Bacteroidota bacterium]
MNLANTFGLSLIVVAQAFAGSSSKVITAIRTDRPPVIDGMVNDPQWQQAPAALDFTQFDPNEGALPTEQTSVRILYDDRALYVGVICYDSKPELIVHQLTRRDRGSEADRFTVQIDSYHDRQTAFVFSTNVSGVQSDGVLSQDGALYDITLDAVWNVKTAMYLDGWSAEFEIPYNALRFSEQDGEELEWGINFRRYISRKHETNEWVMVPRSERLQISRWGNVRGLRDIVPPLHLNISPYVSGTSTFHPENSHWFETSSHKVRGGLDLKYGITRNFTLDATVNPDFGQVEVDQAVLNLTVFETRYPEKRPFFVEGSQLFTFGAGVDNTSMPLFFSRRIGKQPSGAFSFSPPIGGSVKENPLVTTILGAAKVSGRSNDGLSLGALTALTDEEHAIILNPAGSSSRIRTEPRGLYNVIRVKQDFKGASWIGAVATTASRENLPPALSAGVDWNLRLDDGTYAIDGYVAGARPASPVLHRDGLTGRLLASRIAAEHWLYTTSYDFSSRHFDPNDIGFFAQPHDHGGYMQLLYRENFAVGILRRYSTALNPEYRWNWDGILTHAVVNAEFNGEFTNFWLGRFLYTYALPAYDDAERGIIGTYKRPAGHTFRLSVTTDQRRNVSLSLTTIYDTDVRRKRGTIEQLAVTLRLASWIELTPIVLYSSTRQEEGAVFPSLIRPTSLFADRDVDQLDLELRGIVTFTRDFSLQFFTQVFLARGKYTNYRQLISSTGLTPVQSPSINPDFNRVTFNANVLLRWEYLPGSTMYLVWTQGRFEDSGNYASGFSRRFGDTFSLPHEDVLLLKVSYWLPF